MRYVPLSMFPSNFEIRPKSPGKNPAERERGSQLVIQPDFAEILCEILDLSQVPTHPNTKLAEETKMREMEDKEKLYDLTVSAANRLARLLEMKAPKAILENEKEILDKRLRRLLEVLNQNSN